MKKRWLVFFLLLPTLHSFSQFYISGIDPSSVKWSLKKASDFSIVYPHSDSLIAKSFINSFIYYSDSMQFALPGPKLNLPFLLHTSSSISNGVTSWAPRRIEFFSRPPFDTYAQPWSDQLVVHEYRHALQINALKSGLTGTLSSVFGEVVPGAVAGLHLPTWFLEGDAVYSETMLSKAGRGRDPLFLDIFRAQLHRKEKLSYNQCAFGTYIKTQANSYEFGYHMVIYTRSLSNQNIWPEAITYSGRQAWRPAALSYAVKQKTGSNLKDIFEKMCDSLKALPVAKASGISISPKLKQESSLLYPKSLRPDQFTALLRAPGERDKIIIWDTTLKVNRKILVGRIDPSSLSANNGLIYWTEFLQSSRWSHRSWSELWCYDANNKRKRRLSTKTSWYNPTISADGSLLAVIEWNNSDHSSILLFDLSDPKKRRNLNSKMAVSTIRFPQGKLAMKPVFASNRSMICIVLEGSAKALYEVDLTNSKITRLSDDTQMLLDDPYAISEAECLVTTQVENEGVIALYNKKNKRLTPVARGAFGASMPSFTSSGNILFSAYTPYGWETRVGALKDSTVFENNTPFPLTERNLKLKQYYKEDFSHFITPKNTNQISSTQRYSKLSNPFIFHSWTPVSISVDDNEVYPGLTLFSQNLLGTLVTSLGYEYRDSPGKHKIYSKIEYSGLFPVLSVELNNTMGNIALLTSSSHKIIGDYNNLSATFKASIPLVYEKSNRIIRFTTTLEGTVDRIKVNYIENDTSREISKRFPRIGLILNLTRQTRMSSLDLQPRLGFGIYTEVRLCEEDRIDQYMSIAYQSTAWLPGITRHSGLRISLGLEIRGENDNNPLSLILSMPRGIADVPHRAALHLTSTYRFPIAYPNWGSNMLLYIKRLHGAIFYDPSYINYRGRDYSISSYGAELWCDYHLFRFQVPLSTGIRYSFINPDKTVLTEVMFAANFDALFFRR